MERKKRLAAFQREWRQQDCSKMPKIAQKKRHNIYYHYLLPWLQAVNMAITI